jgi:hypothetical protein
MSKLIVIAENEEIRKAWNYILPEKNKPNRYNPIQSIPLLTKQHCTKIRAKKAKPQNRR